MLDFLPTLNALLNTASAVLLVSGRHFIKQGRREVHKRFMIGSFIASMLFFVSYVVYHAQHGTTRFSGQGWIRTLYFTVLGTHTVLAVAVPPLAITTLSLALQGNFRRHPKIARWTYPIWLYVSITGVFVYLMLYQFFPTS